MPDPVVSPGQKLWYVPTDLRAREHGCRWVTVAKVGREWFTVEEMARARFSLRTLKQDGARHSSRSTLWRSKDSFEQSIASQRVWEDLRARVSNAYRLPSGVTAERCAQALALLNLGGDE